MDTVQIGQHKFTMPASFKDEGRGTFTGYANVTGIVDLGNERVLAGAFKRDLATRGAVRPLLFSHNPDEPIGTVTLAEDERGLRVVKGQIVLDVQRGREIYALMKLPGALGGMSIGFNVEKERFDQGVREILELSVWEVSLCCFPMNPASVVDSWKADTGDERVLVRSLNGIARSLEDMMRKSDPFGSFDRGIRRLKALLR